ncbi:uncharacterized protein FOBCDRAFT_234932 [Fusarium oxysporum Fo47]|nr:uncharacterized protein FOBCDRAFT_234932 [Fusarium oxysporum Fo47]QKD46515.2 hypothetical protein FOBCDRAFT_234932 [Fusarium oxysporum Fo47]
MARRIFVIGATGAQGLPVCRGLTKDGAYSLRVLTRDVNSQRAKQLAELGDVEFIEGSFANEDNLRKGYEGCWGTFVNIDGFNTGEKTETYWTIRAYELAIESGIKFFVFGNLDYGYKKSGYDPKFRCGHYDGKGRMAEWMLSQRKAHSMGTAIFTTGPYIEMAISAQTVMTPRIVEGVVTWAVPLADGAIPHVALDDCDHYVRWLFDNPERSDGLDLEVAIDHITYHDLAQAFQKVTGKPAQFIDITLATYFEHMPLKGTVPAGYNADPNDPATMTFKQNFTGFWNMWRNSGGNKGVVQRDYKLLDEIHPNRIKSAEEFFRREEEKRKSQGLPSIFETIESGNLGMILKLSEDGRKGKLEIIHATKNLHHVLDCFSASRFDELLWIDALRIDQQNPQERASQVAMMGRHLLTCTIRPCFLITGSGALQLGAKLYRGDFSRHDDTLRSFHLTSSHSPSLNASHVQCGDRLIDAAIVRKACSSWIDHENSCCWAARRPIDGSAHGLLDIPSEMNGGLTIHTATLQMKHLMDMLVPGKLYTEDFLAAIYLFQVAEIQASAPGDPSIIPGSALGGITVINEWQRAFDNAVSGGFSSMKWLQGSLEYTKAYQAWLEWFVSSEVALAKSCRQIIQDFDELIRQASERRRFIVTSDGQKLHKVTRTYAKKFLKSP